MDEDQRLDYTKWEMKLLDRERLLATALYKVRDAAAKEGRAELLQKFVASGMTTPQFSALRA